MRPGRLSRKVVVPLPDEGGRAQILAVHLRNTPMASTDAKRHACAMVAKLTSNMSGAELANVCNEAALLAGRRSAEVRVHLLPHSALASSSLEPLSHSTCILPEEALFCPRQSITLPALQTPAFRLLVHEVDRLMCMCTGGGVNGPVRGRAPHQARSERRTPQFLASQLAETTERVPGEHPFVQQADAADAHFTLAVLLRIGSFAVDSSPPRPCQGAGKLHVRFLNGQACD